jgi:hypothetical protein
MLALSEHLLVDRRCSSRFSFSSAAFPGMMCEPALFLHRPVTDE